MQRRINTRPLPPLWWLAPATIAGCLVITGYFLVDTAIMQQWLTDGTNWITGKGGTGWAVFIAITSLSAACGLPPASFLAFAAGNVYGLWTGLALASSGLFSGAIIAFLLGRYLARKHVEKTLRQKPVFCAIDSALERQGWPVVILLRLSPLIPFTIGSYALSLSSIRFRDYCIGTLGSLPTLFAIVYTGQFAGQLAEAAWSKTHDWNPVQLAATSLGVIASTVIAIGLGRIAARTLKPPSHPPKTDKSPHRHGQASAKTGSKKGHESGEI